MLDNKHAMLGMVTHTIRGQKGKGQMGVGTLCWTRQLGKSSAAMTSEKTDGPWTPAIFQVKKKCR